MKNIVDENKIEGDKENEPNSHNPTSSRPLPPKGKKPAIKSVTFNLIKWWGSLGHYKGPPTTNSSVR